MHPTARATPSAPLRPPVAARGFSLIELMIAVAIVAILIAVALPAYRDSVRKGRRSEALAALATVQQQQERFRANNPTYGNLNSPADALTLPNVPATTSHGYYAITVSNPLATSYTATATAQGAQADDTPCKLMAVRVVSGSIGYGSGATTVDWADPGRCFAK